MIVLVVTCRLAKIGVSRVLAVPFITAVEEVPRSVQLVRSRLTNEVHDDPAETTNLGSSGDACKARLLEVVKIHLDLNLSTFGTVHRDAVKDKLSTLCRTAKGRVVSTRTERATARRATIGVADDTRNVVD